MKQHQHILMIEDDPMQGETIRAHLAERFNLAVSNVEWLYTESDFYRRLGDMKRDASRIPDLVVSDVMLPWAFYGEGQDIEPPDDLAEGGIRRAGLRCRKAFRELGKVAQKVSWVYFTILGEDALNPSDVDDRATLVMKEEGYSKLDEMIEFLDRGPWHASETKVTEDLLRQDGESLLSALRENWREAVVWKLRTA